MKAVFVTPFVRDDHFQLTQATTFRALLMNLVDVPELYEKLVQPVSYHLVLYMFMDGLCIWFMQLSLIRWCQPHVLGTVNAWQLN